MKLQKAGFGLAETLIASAILATLVLVFYGVSSSINRNTARANERSGAALIAQQELENIRYNKDKNWNDSRAIDSAVANWDQNVLSYAGVNINRCSNWSPVTDTVYEKRVCIYRNSDNSLPFLSFQNSNSGNTEELEHNQYKDDYLLIEVDIKWNGVVNNSQYSLSSIITNWQPAVL